MPTKHEIVNGPPFKYFLLRGHAIDGCGSVVQFELNGCKTLDDRGTSVYVAMIGKPIGGSDDGDDEYTFVAVSHSGSFSRKLGPYWLIGRYNTQTRKGTCLKYEEDEVFKFPIGRTLFRDQFQSWLYPQP